MVYGILFITQLVVSIAIMLISGLIRIIFDINKLARLCVIILIVAADIFFIMPSCTTFQESIIHIVIISLPICYILKN